MAGESEGYIDTSVLGAYYCAEALSVAAEAAMRALRTPVISTLSEVEFCSLVAKKCRLKELKLRQAKEVLDLLANHITGGFYRRVSVSTEHFINARNLVASMSSPLRTLDALHLAVAQSEGLTLITADRVFAQAAKRHRVRAVLIGSR